MAQMRLNMGQLQSELDESALNNTLLNMKYMTLYQQSEDLKSTLDTQNAGMQMFTLKYTELETSMEALKTNS